MAFMGLTKHINLPIEDAVSFKDFLDRRTDQDLKLIFLMVEVASKFGDSSGLDVEVG